MTQEQLNIQSLFEHHDAHDDIDATKHANLMQTSSAQHVYEDEGTAHDDDSAQIPTLADVPTGRQDEHSRKTLLSYSCATTFLRYDY